jgi:cobalamin biosynthesis protein CobC
MARGMDENAADNSGDREGAAGALFYHGGNRGAARLAFPRAELPWIDLSTGINPVAYPVADLSDEDWTRLPEPGATDALCAAAASAYGVALAECVAAPGTQALLQWLPRLFPARRVGILGFTYAEHARCWAASGAEVVTTPDLADLAGFDVAVIVNPNNPDGRCVAPEDVTSLAETMARSGGLLIVDEAFADVLPDGFSVAGKVSGLASLIVLRSFGKSYGLAGARLGFALTGRARAARLREALGPWAVSGPTLTLGRRALADRGWLAAARQRLQADERRLAGLLRGAGLPSVGGTPLFTLVEHDDAHAIFRRLGERGILVRAFAAAPRWLRFGQPAPSAWALLEDRLSRL